MKATQHLLLLGATHWQHWNIIKSFLIPVPCPDTNCIHLFILSYAIGAIIFSALLSTLVKKQYDIKQKYPECKVARIVLIYTLACPISWPSAPTLMPQWTFRLLFFFPLMAMNNAFTWIERTCPRWHFGLCEIYF